mgnify:CR=1 FL=1
MLGRPKLGVKQTTVRLTPEARARIEALVGSQGMSAFVREAVMRELESRELELHRKKQGDAAPQDTDTH